MDEQSKAVAIKEAIKQIAKPVQDFIKGVSGPPAKELGEWMADGIRGYRFKTQLKIYTSAMQMLESSRLSPKRVNLKILVPLLENGSLEEDTTMIDMWSSLLANAASDSGNEVSVSFPGILKELNPQEAKILDVIYDEAKKRTTIPSPETDVYVISVNGDAVRSISGLSPETFEQGVDNLYRLRLLSPPATKLNFIDKNKDTPFMLYTKKTICLTFLGYYFMKACVPPAKIKTLRSASFR